jgi:hypothetical protein
MKTKVGCISERGAAVLRKVMALYGFCTVCCSIA